MRRPLKNFPHICFHVLCFLHFLTGTLLKRERPSRNHFVFTLITSPLGFLISRFVKLQRKQTLIVGGDSLRWIFSLQCSVQAQVWLFVLLVNGRQVWHKGLIHVESHLSVCDSKCFPTCGKKIITIIKRPHFRTEGSTTPSSSKIQKGRNYLFI